VNTKKLVAFTLSLASASLLRLSEVRAVDTAVADLQEEALRLKGIMLVENGGQTGIVIDLSRPPQLVKHFTLTNPSRMVVDIQGPVAGDLGPVAQAAEDAPYVSRVRLGHQDGRLRIAVDLKEPAPPSVTVDERKTMVVALLGERSGRSAAVKSQLLYGEVSEAAGIVTPSEPPVAPEIRSVKADASEPEASETAVSPEASPTEAGTSPAAEKTVPAAKSSQMGLRDPFRPFNVALRADPAPPRTPLERYALGSLKLVAVIYDTRNPKAMVEDDLGLGHTVTLGTRIGNQGGVVKTIDSDRVVVEEELADFYGEKKKSETVLRLQPRGDGH